MVQVQCRMVQNEGVCRTESHTDMCIFLDLGLDLVPGNWEGNYWEGKGHYFPLFPQG